MRRLSVLGRPGLLFGSGYVEEAKEWYFHHMVGTEGHRCVRCHHMLRSCVSSLPAVYLWGAAVFCERV